MSEGRNLWMGLGNLAADPELRFTKSQEPVLSFRIACSESYFDKKSNERKERVEFVSCVLWGKRGEALSKHLSKGSRVDITGRLQTRSWEKDGEKRYATEINVQNVILLGDGGGKRRESSQDSGSHGAYDHQQDAGSSFDNSDESIPF